MASEVKICNRALSRIGIYGNLSSLNDANSKEARECKLWYETCRDAVLEDHDWTFARKSKVLNLGVEVYPGWAFTYQMPVDCIAPRYINDPSARPDEGKEPIPFECRASEDRNRNLILTDWEKAELIYTAKVTDVNLFSSSYEVALCYRLAAELAVALRSKTELADKMMALYDLQLRRAKQVDLMKGSDKKSNTNSFMDARR